MAKLSATLIPGSEINNGVRAHVSVAEAAKMLGVSEATVRRAARRLGVRRIAGRTIRGGMLIDRSPVPLLIAYAE